MMPAQTDALRRYAGLHGRCWKASLRNASALTKTDPLLLIEADPAVAHVLAIRWPNTSISVGARR
jgi:hypothetical protein